MRARWFVCGLITGVTLTAIGGSAQAADVDVAYKKLRVFSQVLTYVQQSYVDDVDPQELLYDAINGMLAHLDPHTTFLRPAEYEKLREDTAGEFGGLGIEVGIMGEAKEAVVVVEDVHKDGPGAHAGLKIGDLILAVDGENTRGTALPHAVRLMRGVPGTRVVLTLSRAAWTKARDVPLVRRQVRVAAVDKDSFEAPGAPFIGYVSISSFQERTDQELAAAIADLRKQARDRSIPQLSGLVLDLRDNPGGLLDEGVKVADRFLLSGTIVTTEGRSEKSAGKDTAHEEGTEPNYPVVVLVNGDTASASEIVAGALQDHKRAVVVGERSFGKGSVQTLFGLDDGAGLKLTIARYFTPSGRSIQDKGVVPDVVVRGVRDLPASARGPARVAVDPQLAAAVEQIRKAVTRPLAGAGR
ncbi:MAG: S41 family peptidase [Deltaproteobacteria bacterium]|nr:S41 family peptidase [Deltaproteobacteria bacterium]